MTDRRARAVGVGLLALLAVHVVLHEEGAWLLLAACDLAAAATGLGLVLGWHRMVAAAFVFQVSVGLPSFLVGVLTTYVPNLTSIGIHLLPPAAGALAVRRRGLPRYAAATAFGVYVVALVSSHALPPPGLNLNLVRTVWPPLARLFTTPALYYVLVLGAGPLVFLSLGELGLRSLLRARGARSRAGSTPAP